MTDKTSLGNRMKEYEAVTDFTLTRRTPVIIRVDGRAFHTFTKRIIPELDETLYSGPFSEQLHLIMSNTALAMCANIQNAVFAYVQSDEISILLCDWRKHETEQWFGARLSKIVSISAAMASTYFNLYLEQQLPTLKPHCCPVIPLFDSRAWNLPKEEVCNYFIWRQQDASRNSINMLGQYHFPHKKLHGKNTSQVQDMLMELEPPVNWNDISIWKRRGSVVVSDANVGFTQDWGPPIFTKDRNFIERYLNVEDRETQVG